VVFVNTGACSLMASRDGPVAESPSSGRACGSCRQDRSYRFSESSRVALRPEQRESNGRKSKGTEWGLSRMHDRTLDHLPHLTRLISELAMIDRRGRANHPLPARALPLRAWLRPGGRAGGGLFRDRRKASRRESPRGRAARRPGAGNREARLARA
jgi:hypothetical protein